jgi:hypothetical protein
VLIVNKLRSHAPAAMPNIKQSSLDASAMSIPSNLLVASAFVSNTHSTTIGSDQVKDSHNHRMNRARSEPPSLLFALESLPAAGCGTPTQPSTASIAGGTNASPSHVEEDDQMPEEGLSQDR